MAHNPSQIFRTNIMEQVVDDLEFLFQTELSNHEGIPPNFIDYLKTLKPRLMQFHENINNHDGDVRMPYIDKEVQIIYVLKYFHAYWYQIKHALDEIKEKLITKKELKIGLFCAGACPEVIGITRFLEENPNNFSSVDIHIYDEINEWKFARDNFVFSNRKIELMKKNLGINLYFHSINLTNQDDLNRFKILNFFDVISFQNCLGEFAYGSMDSSSTNFLKILESLKPNGFVIFSDRQKLSAVEKNISRILDFSRINKYETIFQEQDLVYKAIEDSDIPKKLTRGNFYRDPYHSAEGRSAMKRNRYQMLILQKPKEHNNSDQCVASNSDSSFSYDGYKSGGTPDLTDDAHINVLVVDEDIDNKEKKLSLPNSWSPEYGTKLFHDDYGIGIVGKIFKSKSQTKIVVNFEDHGPIEVGLPSKALKLIK